MKSILISIHPEWVIKIFNGDKTAEIRRTAPKEWKDYLSGKTKIKPEPMTGYIYCTDPNAKETLSLFAKEAREHHGRVAEFIERKRVDNPDMRWSICNGKVVASFTLREVERIYLSDVTCGNPEERTYEIETSSLSSQELCHASCLNENGIWDYLPKGKGYAWYISDLVIFDEPMEISDFGPEDKVYYQKGASEVVIEMKRLNRGPQSWQYVENHCGE